MVAFGIHKKDKHFFYILFLACINRTDLENWSLLLKGTVKDYKPKNATSFNLINFDKKQSLVGICFISVK